jgi:divalent metal cation (Fe/Co/Zn/Cd) transporter
MTCDRGQLLHRALQLSWLSVIFGALSGTVSVGSGLIAGSLGVLASGMSVLADMTSSIVLVWRFRVERSDPERAERVERIATRVVSTLLVLIAVVLAIESIIALLSGSHPGSGTVTVIVSAVSFVVLVPLAGAKRATGTALGSRALRGDGMLSAIGAGTALFALIGLVLFHLFGWWWADRAVALAIAAVAAYQARAMAVVEEEAEEEEIEGAAADEE